MKIIMLVCAFVVMTMGVILIVDADSRTFILEGYMIQKQQEMLGLIMCVLGIGMLILFITDPWPWVRKTTCVNCHTVKTRNRNDDDLPVCDDCEYNIEKQALIDKVKDENILMCPVDGSKMDKLVLSGTRIVVDQCPTCKGAWLNKNETEELEEDLGQQESSGSFSSGMIIGMSVGRIG